MLLMGLVLMMLEGTSAEERTVVVTPRPRWAALRTPSEHTVLSSHPASFSLPPRKIINLVVMTDSGLISSPTTASQVTSDPQHTLTRISSTNIEPVTVAVSPPPPVATSSDPSPSGVIALPPPYRLARPREFTLVKTVPSLSVKIEEPLPQKKGDLPDYLIPPRYPSVYEDHVPSKTTPAPKKRKVNKKRKKPAKADFEEDATKFEDIQRMLSSSGDRIEFQLHGQSGPDSYKFGYDTGAGKNRQFRYEEKDSLGNVRGHYGYYDPSGKLLMFSYIADKTGYHAIQVG